MKLPENLDQSLSKFLLKMTTILTLNKIDYDYMFNHTLGKITRSDWLRYCESVRNFRANSVIRGKLQISRAKSVIHSECKYKKELMIKSHFL